MPNDEVPDVPDDLSALGPKDRNLVAAHIAASDLPIPDLMHFLQVVDVIAQVWDGTGAEDGRLLFDFVFKGVAVPRFPEADDVPGDHTHIAPLRISQDQMETILAMVFSAANQRGIELHIPEVRDFETFDQLIDEQATTWRKGEDNDQGSE